MAVPMLAEAEVAARAWRTAPMLAADSYGRFRWSGHGTVIVLLSRHGRSLVGADRGVGDRREHHGERHQDGREAADPSPECSKSRHGRVYTWVVAEE